MANGPVQAGVLNGTAKRRIGLSDCARWLAQADDILIASHLRPDADCLGSALGLCMALESLGKRVAVYNISRLTERLLFLPGIERVSPTLPPWPVRHTVFVDCGSAKRVSPTFAPIGRSLNIDHHTTNTCFAEDNFIEPSAAAVGDQVARLLDAMGIPLTPEIAMNLYTAVMGDTGGFRFPSTNADTFELAARLVRAGANPGVAGQCYFETRERGELTLTARAMTRAEFEFNGALVWSELLLSDYNEAGGEDVEPEGLVNELRTVSGVEVSLLMHEVKGGGVRAGLRGKGNIDCSAIAEQCGGGGHFNAAGLMLEGVPFGEGKARVLAIVRDAVAKLLASRPAPAGGAPLPLAKAI